MQSKFTDQVLMMEKKRIAADLWKAYLNGRLNHPNKQDIASILPIMRTFDLASEDISENSTCPTHHLEGFVRSIERTGDLQPIKKLLLEMEISGSDSK